MSKFVGFVKGRKVLCVAVAMIVLGSFLAGLFNSSFFNVRVSQVSFETDNGVLTGLLYMPRGAGADNPRPVIVTTHGYLNSKEMQDLTAIEMSRRGYIVLAISMYDHGASRWAGDIPVGGQFGTFWIHAQMSAVQYMFQQPFTARDADGNGLIAVTGHSMGGFSSVLAMYFDEMQSLQSGVRMIAAGLPVGADMSFAASVAPVDQLIAGFGSRPVGFIAGLYDEFFFNEAGSHAQGETVRRSYWPETAVGKMFLGLDPAGPAGVSGQQYMAESGVLMLGDSPVRASEVGQRIIYVPDEIHPWNHFSATSVAYMIDFFDWAFPNQYNEVNASSQIWQWKVFFNFVTLVGFFLLIVPVMSLLLKLPGFKLAITKEQRPVPMGDAIYQKVIFWAFVVISALLPAYLIPVAMERREDGLNALCIIFLAMGIAAVVAGIVFLVIAKGNERFKRWGVGGIVFGVTSGLAWLLVSNPDNVLDLGPMLSAPTVNVIGYWALLSAGIAALITFGFYYLSRKALGAGPRNYGVCASPVAIIASLVVAVVGIAIMYLVLFVMHGIFTVDARLWVFAVRVFTVEHFLATLRYLPFFFIFYLANTIGINANARGRKLGYLIAIWMNIGGIIIWIALQYGALLSSGVARYPSMALNAILLFGLIPVLGIAAVFARKLYDKTNNVYLAAFTNTILFTLISVANTAVFWNMVAA